MSLLFLLQGTLGIFLGILMPRIGAIGPNRWVGIRTAQTLQDERVWRLAHRSSIVPFFGYGVCNVVLWFWARSKYFDFYVALALQAILSVVLVVGILRCVGEAKLGVSDETRSSVENGRSLFWAGVLLGLTFLGLGMLMPVAGDYGPNGWFGIRTPISTQSLENWRSIHSSARLPLIFASLVWLAFNFLVVGLGSTGKGRKGIWVVGAYAFALGIGLWMLLLKP